MTAFSLTPAQRAFVAEVRGHAAGELRALAEAGQPGQVNRDLVKAMGGLGLLGRLFPGAAAGGGRAAAEPSSGAGTDEPSSWAGTE